MNGKRKITAEENSKLSDIFEVSSDYLLGRKVDLGNTTVAAHMNDNLTKEQLEAIEEFIEFQKAKYKKKHENKNK